MLRIMKYLSKAEIGQMLIALVTIVGQVYFDLKLPDYMSDITTLVETPGSHMKDIWIAGGKMLLISLGSAACAIITGYIAGARGGLVHPASALARIPQGRVLRPGRNEQVLHRQPHHPLHQRRHAGADVHHHGSAAHRQIADYGSMGRVQDRRRRLRMDARHRNRRSDSAGGHRHHDGHGHAEIQGHAGPDRQHQPRGPREPHRPACGARLQRRGLPGSQIHQGQQGPHRHPAVHQPRHGVHDAADEHQS